MVFAEVMGNNKMTCSVTQPGDALYPGDGRNDKQSFLFPVVQTSITTHTVFHTRKRNEIQAETELCQAGLVC